MAALVQPQGLPLRNLISGRDLILRVLAHAKSLSEVAPRGAITRELHAATADKTL